MRKINKIIGLMKIYYLKFFKGQDITFDTSIYIHPSVEIKLEKNARLYLGKRCNILNHTKIILKESSNIKIEEDCSILERSHIETDKNGKIVINEKNFFNTETKIYASKSISFGYNNAFGPACLIIDNDHVLDRKKDEKYNDWSKHSDKEIKIGNNNWIGANAIILKGTTIGNDSIIGASTLIKSNIDSECIAYNKRELIIRKRE